MGMTYKEKLEKAKMRNITIPSEILEKDIVGVYKFFAILEDEKVCFYIYTYGVENPIMAIENLSATT